jgi:cytochrome P450
LSFRFRAKKLFKASFFFFFYLHHSLSFMSRDPRHYSDPHIFNPTRFLGPNPELDPRVWLFGFGRRVCPGQHLADALVFLACTTALATLRIEKAVDGTGVPIEPTFEYRGKFVTYVASLL